MCFLLFHRSRQTFVNRDFFKNPAIASPRYPRLTEKFDFSLCLSVIDGLRLEQVVEHHLFVARVSQEIGRMIRRETGDSLVASEFAPKPADGRFRLEQPLRGEFPKRQDESGLYDGELLVKIRLAAIDLGPARGCDCPAGGISGCCRCRPPAAAPR